MRRLYIGASTGVYIADLSGAQKTLTIENLSAPMLAGQDIGCIAAGAAGTLYAVDERQLWRSNRSRRDVANA